MGSESLLEIEYAKQTDGKVPGSNYDENNRTIEEGTFTKIMLWPFRLFAAKFSAGSIKGSIFTLIKATIGSGIIVMPNALSVSGFAWGLIQFALCGWLGYYSLMLLVKCADKAKVYSYQELAYVTEGKKFRLFTNITCFFGNWGSAVAYLVLIAQLVSKALYNFFGSRLPDWMTDPNSISWLVIVSTALVLPMSLARELKSLRYFCIIGFNFIIYLAFVVIYEAFTFSDIKQSWNDISNFEWSGTSTTFSTAVFAYLSQPNLLDVYKELQRPSERRIRKVVLRTTILVFVMYVLVGGFGYLTFASNLQLLNGKDFGNSVILFAYGYDLQSSQQISFPILPLVAFFFIGFSVIIGTPLCIKPAKDGLSDMFFPKKDPFEVDPPFRHFVFVFITVYSAVLIAALSSSVQNVISIMGSSFFTIICFVLPPYFYIKLSKDEKLVGHKLACYIMLIFFTGFTVWSTYESIMTTINS